MFDRHRVRTFAGHLRSADQLLQTLSRVRSGSAFSRALGVAAATGQVLNLVFPERSLHDELVARGYRSFDSAIDSFLCDLLLVSDLPRSEARIGETARLVAWDDGRVVAVWSKSGELEAGPYLRPTAELPALVQRVAWGAGEDLALVQERIDDKRVKLGLQPMKPPGDYLGDPDPDRLTERLQKRRAGSMLLYGPSGSGKSTLARIVGRRLRPGGRTLKLSTGVLLRQASSSALLTLVRVLRPTVLLLDDVQEILDHDDRYGKTSMDPDFGDLLALMESLHGEDAFVIATLMTAPGSKLDGRMREGDLYFPGLRPGRIDVIQGVTSPNEAWRTRILRHYLGEAPSAEIVKETAGLTGAYLQELAVRLRAWGMEDWKDEVKSLRLAAPRMRRSSHRGSENSFLYQELGALRRKISAVEERLPPKPEETEESEASSGSLSTSVKSRRSRRRG